MSTLVKAKELLTNLEAQISDLTRQLKALRADRTQVARMVARLGSGKAAPRRGRRKASKARARSSKKKAAAKGRRRRSGGGRTNWAALITSMGQSFSLDDLVKASRKKKATVSQAVQNLKKAKKIVATAKRGVYKKA